MNDEKPGVDVLRESIDTVAADLESRRPSGARATRGRSALLAAAAAVAAIAAGVWLLRPAPAAEVEILELRIRGRAVSGIVLDDPAAGGLIVLPQVGGPPMAALDRMGETP